MEHLKIERLTRDKLKDVQYIIKEVFNKKYSLKYLENKYNSLKYCDVEYIGTLGYVNDKPIAFYGALPLIFTDGNNQILGVQTCDSYTKKEFQGKGVHYQLALACYDIIKPLGAHFVFAFHSENTFHSCKKLEWQEQRRIRRFEIDSGVKFSFFKVLSKYKFLKGVKEFKIKQALKEFTELKFIENPFNKHDYISVIYSNEYIEYKNFNSNKIIQVGECIVWLKLDFVMQIGVIQNLTKENIKQTFTSLKNTCKKLGIKKIIIQMSDDNEEYELLKQEFNAKESWLVGYKSFTNLNFNNARFNWIELDSFL